MIDCRRTKKVDIEWTQFYREARSRVAEKAMTGLPGAAVVVALLLAAAQATAEVATGCLTRLGTINKVAIGNEPKVACGSRQTEITLQLGGGSSEPHFRFVGVTTATATGAAGIFGLSDLCAEEFSGSRVCMSRELIETVDPPLEPGREPVRAWIHPTFVPTEGTDISGLPADTCSGWSSNSRTQLGLSVHAYLGSFTRLPCDQVLPAACCAP
jgi:hypothetical protein